MESEGRLIILSGPSGAGKSTLIDALLLHRRVSFVTPYTSRRPRTSETSGWDYHFRTSNEFRREILNGTIKNWDYALRNYYGFGALGYGCRVTHSLARMALRIREATPHVSLVFLKPSDADAHFRRLRELFSDPVDLGLRSAHYEEEIEHSSMFDHVFDTSGADQALDATGLWDALGLRRRID